MKLLKTLFLTGLISIIYAGAAFAQGNGSITGSVTDAAGAVIPGATVTAVDAAGKTKQVVANARGEYTITGLAAGTYTLKAIAKDFGLYQNAEVVVTGGAKTEQLITLIISEIKETVDIDNSKMVSTDADNNKDATVLSGKDLDALPDDPDELQAALQALVGASAGPNGGQIYIDGFTGGQLPSKDQIREIRINQNPFSAEFDRPGNGRIEILTKPGSDKFRGSANGAFNDESLNSRNPFALNRASSQQRRFGGNFSGPITKGKSSFTIEANLNSTDNNALINAQILDSSFGITNLRKDVAQPTRRFSINPRLDFAINSKNTAVARYTFSSSTNKNQGIGDTSLLSRASANTSHEHEVRITETMIINPKTVNETRFEFSKSRRDTTGDNSVPGINVVSAFIGGGAQVGHSFNDNKTIEINNFTSTSFGKRLQHSFKFGGRFRHVSILDRSESGYAGTFSFTGIFLPAGTTDVCDVDSDNVVTSIEQYRCKVQGIGGNRYNPTQFSITTGNPQLGIAQTDGALFVSDDWKVRPDFQLGLGLRYENQTNIHSAFNFAPRLSLAFSPGAGGAKGPHFVVRAGAGIFYDRFGENNSLAALRNNGLNQFNLQVSATDPDPARRAIALSLLAQPVFTLAGVTNVPTGAQVQAVLPSSSTIRQVSPILQAPYTIQSVFSFEKTLSPKLTLSTNFQLARTLHAIRTRNVNAPICPNFYASTTICNGAPRPLPAFTNINAYESSGVLNRMTGGVFLNARLTTKVSFFANYSIVSIKSNADTPVYAYDLSGEYAPIGGVPRHNFSLFGSFTLPWGISISPQIGYRTGTRFNITSGADNNGDLNFVERPTFAQLANACVKNNITASFCNVTGFDPAAIIPKNFGVGSSAFTSSVRINRTFSFGKEAATRADGGGNRGGGAGGAGGGGNRGGGGGPQMVMMGGGGGGDRGGMMGGFGGGGGRRPYNLNLSMQVTNPLNKVNLNNPVGNITSFRFGQSTATSGSFGGFGGFGGGGTTANRRIELQARFSW